MQKLAAYLLERRDGMGRSEARAAEAKVIQQEVVKWLASKGGTIDASRRGSYKPEDGSKGSYRIDEAVDGERTWWFLSLQEDTTGGRRFTASLSITAGSQQVTVYVTLETGWTTSGIMPVSVDPRCPKVVRDLLTLPGPWYHGSSTALRSLLLPIKGFAAGEGLVAEIQHEGRTVPLVVVSTDAKGDFVLPDLAARLAYDLAGLATVVVVDEDASWALTDTLGSDWCCYWGAVRLFWPHFSKQHERYLHPLWTAERLRSTGDDPIQARDRFRRQLRRLVFGASALSVVQPSEIDEIRDAVAKSAMSSIRQRATSMEGYEELAVAYSKENDELRSTLSAVRAELAQSQEQVARLEVDRQALLTHLRAARAGDAGDPSMDQGPMDADAEGSDVRPPEAGEVRYYKKVYARPAHDVMVRVEDCGCNKWQNSHSADKARKGISRLENGRTDWKTMQHCGGCTGGGMWKIRW